MAWDDSTLSMQRRPKDLGHEWLMQRQYFEIMVPNPDEDLLIIMKVNQTRFNSAAYQLHECRWGDQESCTVSTCVVQSFSKAMVSAVVDQYVGIGKILGHIQMIALIPLRWMISFRSPAIILKTRGRPRFVAGSSTAF
jgi:hypothetical protein